MLHFLLTLIIGGILGLIASLILNEEVPGGATGMVLIGFLGSWLGESILGELGPSISGFYLVPSLLGHFLSRCLYVFSRLYSPTLLEIKIAEMIDTLESS